MCNTNQTNCAAHNHKLFSSVYADYKSQLELCALNIGDDEATENARNAFVDGQICAEQFAAALCNQLRYVEAAQTLSDALISSDDYALHRRLALCYMKTARFKEAKAEYLWCLLHGGDKLDVTYRLGLVCFYSGDYAAALDYFCACYPLCKQDGDMRVAVIYWHILSLVKLNRPYLDAADNYSDDIKIGHHEGYMLVCRLFKGLASLDELCAQTENADEMTFTLFAYGAYHYALANGLYADGYLKSVLEKQKYWASFAWLAAYVDGKGFL